MIKTTKNLQIGNTVEHRSQKCTVVGIKEDSITLRNENRRETTVTPVNGVYDVEGIPITPQSLCWLGLYDRNREGVYKRIIGDTILLVYKTANEWVLKSAPVNMQMVYIHQLQNAIEFIIEEEDGI